MQCQLDPSQSSSSQDCVERGFDAYVKDWDKTGNKYHLVRQFCGGVAVVCSGTATVEPDFSSLGREGTEKKSNITKLTFSGVMHANSGIKCVNVAVFYCLFDFKLVFFGMTRKHKLLISIWVKGGHSFHMSPFVPIHREWGNEDFVPI